jgi:hypothetical protein
VRALIVAVTVMSTLVAGCGSSGDSGPSKSDFKKQLVDVCTAGGAPAATCNCAADYLLARHSVSELQNIDAARSQALQVDAFAHCPKP